MTLWISNHNLERRPSVDFQLAKEAVGRLEDALGNEEHKRSPEWESINEALLEKRLKVVSVGLEVFASHFREQLPNPIKRVIEDLADSIRHSRRGKLKAIITSLLKNKALNRLGVA